MFLIEDFNVSVLTTEVPARCPDPPIQTRAPVVSMLYSILEISLLGMCMVEKPLGSDHK